MKNLILSTLVLLCLLACEPEPIIVAEFEAPTLVGEWQLVEQKVSIGSPATWQKVDDGATFTLKVDGTFTGFQLFNDCQTGTYDTQEGALILTHNCEDSKPFTYALQKENEDIILSPRTVICTETCEYKYRKISE